MTDEAGDDLATTWYGRLRRVLKGDPASREDLLELIREPHWQGVLDPDELAMLEGVLAVSQTQVRDVMVPRSQMTVIEQDWPREQILKTIVDSGHSRFPVMGESHEEVAGILLAKDVLRYFVETPDQKFDLTRWLRTPTFIPEKQAAQHAPQGDPPEPQPSRSSSTSTAALPDAHHRGRLEEIVGRSTTSTMRRKPNPSSRRRPGASWSVRSPASRTSTNI